MFLENKIKKAVALSPMTSFKIGGLADLFFEVKNEKDLSDIFQYIKEERLEYFILGGGSNIIFSDLGFRGIVLKISNSNIEIGNNTAVIGAGKKINEIVNELKDNSLSGLEWAYGIPATLGGLVAGNGGAFGREIKDNIKSIIVYNIEDNSLKTFTKKDCDFKYRESIFKKNKKLIIWKVEMILIKRNKDEIKGEMMKNIDYRKSHQPLDNPSAGSFFKNLKMNQLKEDDWNLIINKIKNKIGIKKLDLIEKNKSIPAGLLIELAGLKGKGIGGVEISTKHGNFLINKKNAKAEDVIILASIIKQKVRQKLGIQLYEEIEYIGF